MCEDGEKIIIKKILKKGQKKRSQEGQIDRRRLKDGVIGKKKSFGKFEVFIFNSSPPPPALSPIPP